MNIDHFNFVSIPTFNEQYVQLLVERPACYLVIPWDLRNINFQMNQIKGLENIHNFKNFTQFENLNSNRAWSGENVKKQILQSLFSDINCFEDYWNWNVSFSNNTHQSVSLECNLVSTVADKCEEVKLLRVPIKHDSPIDEPLDFVAEQPEDEEQSHYALRGYKYKIIYTNEANRRKTHFKCTFEGCHKVFSKTWNFLDHARMHEGMKPFVWDVCSKTFTQKGNMLKHKRQHTMPDVEDRRSYSWTCCHKKYTEKYNLKVSFICLILGVVFYIRLIVNIYIYVNVFLWDN